MLLAGVIGYALYRSSPASIAHFASISFQKKSFCDVFKSPPSLFHAIPHPNPSPSRRGTSIFNSCHFLSSFLLVSSISHWKKLESISSQSVKFIFNAFSKILIETQNAGTFLYFHAYVFRFTIFLRLYIFSFFVTE
ncbi:MAG: hypothetical protein B6229_07255 [Spirochaetaceae bacterium 4572_7]|nr:MAG: hypothetical protein B6229_07255 [Spirochaetaceae bacterium 4572_7]